MRQAMRTIFIVALAVSLIGLPFQAVSSVVGGEFLSSAIELAGLAVLVAMVGFDKSLQKMIMSEYFNLVVTFEGIKAKYRARRG